jgi:hypothetical protein
MKKAMVLVSALTRASYMSLQTISLINMGYGSTGNPETIKVHNWKLCRNI